MSSLLIVVLGIVALVVLAAPAALLSRSRRPATWSAHDRIGVAPDAFDADPQHA
ncbi:hypothetical protein [Solicola sp. PLA-1-18]|uniref:hypothetical protein n=1 Tax=Solicola sp. PLA-1-18 TaxID=3380532 RepID=UPI003B7D9BE7